MDAPLPERSLLRRIDVLGLALFALAIAWTYVAGGETDVVRRTAAVFAAAGAAVIAGRVVARLADWLVPAAVVVAAALVWVLDPAGVTSQKPLEGPFGYANAKGAFFMIAAISVVAAASVSRKPLLVAAGVVAAVPFAVVPFASETLAAFLLVITVPLLALFVHAVAGPRAAVELCGLLVAAALLVTSLIGANHRPTERRGLGERLIAVSLTDRRIALWYEAGTMMAARPLRGVGAGRFAALSPTARSDPDDARWAHNAFLQQGAEAGVVGLGILVALFVWAFLRLALGADALLQTVVAAVVAMAGIHATLDYVLHFPAIPVATAALVGSATATRRRPDGSLT